MQLIFDKEHWLRDKEEFQNDLDELDVELMDKYKDYFFGFMECPVDSYYDNQLIIAKITDLYDEDELRLYLDSHRGTGTKLVLYQILRNENGMIRLRSAMIS